MMDARKWLASKLAPKKYGDKVAAKVSGPDGGPIPPDPMQPQPCTARRKNGEPCGSKAIRGGGNASA